MKLVFYRQIFEKSFKCQIPWKSVKWETDGPTDMTKLAVALRNYEKALQTKQLHRTGTDDHYSLD